jgi:hypothetical protein
MVLSLLSERYSTKAKKVEEYGIKKTHCNTLAIFNIFGQ